MAKGPARATGDRLVAARVIDRADDGTLNSFVDRHPAPDTEVYTEHIVAAMVETAATRAALAAQPPGTDGVPALVAYDGPDPDADDLGPRRHSANAGPARWHFSMALHLSWWVGSIGS
ncbi:MAG: hypothetical protein OXG18_12930 [Gemmatimonadetes bacterium]|nr:hypothetical protein [Gemmatimonadota bacterium]